MTRRGEPLPPTSSDRVRNRISRVRAALGLGSGSG